MRNKSLALMAMAILIAVGTGCLSNTSNSTIKGRVVKDGKPVEGAKVTLTGRNLGKITTYTGDDGRFTLAISHRATSTLQIITEKSGMTQKWLVAFVPFEEIPEEVTVEMTESVSAT